MNHVKPEIMRRIFILGMLLGITLFSEAQSTGNVRDIDGNEYGTVKIGDQVWMLQNIRATRYADGTAIPKVSGEKRWENLEPGEKAYCWLRNDSTTFAETYGALYTWGAAVNYSGNQTSNSSWVQGVCPDGWHVPGDEEFKQLEMHLGMTREEADKRKLRGTTEGCMIAGNAELWADGRLKQNPDFGKSGFMAVPGGLRYVTGKFGDYQLDAYWWTSTSLDDMKAFGRIIPSKDIESYRDAHRKDAGFSVRCLKD